MSRPSWADSKSTVKCCRSFLVSLVSGEEVRVGGVNGGEYETWCGARTERVGLRRGPK